MSKSNQWANDDTPGDGELGECEERGGVWEGGRLGAMADDAMRIKPHPK